MNNIYDLAIVGGGPRGLSALESFCRQMSKIAPNRSFSILLFEATDQMGNGPVYDVNQTDTNWINITERALKLKTREEFKLDHLTIPGFISYHEWANVDYAKISNDTPDHFPPRGTVGKYLYKRFQSIANALINAGLLTVVNQRVHEINHLENKPVLLTQNKETYIAHQAILTIGHQPTKISKQIKKWKDFAKGNDNVVLFENPYPIQNFIDSNLVNENSVIGIRGFGLAMIDIVRGIAEGKGGKFILKDEKTRLVEYQPGKDTPKRFVPFSLNGLPMSPKPLNATIDDWYKPSEKQMNAFEKEIGDSEVQSKATDNSFLLNAIAPIAADVFSNLKNTLEPQLKEEELIEVILEWLKDDSFTHPLILPKDQPTKKTIKDLVGMAVGIGAVSLDFCIGQVWRHCQPTIYKQLSYNHCSDEVIAELVGVDERIKRYSYGPPVESLQQLLALIEADVMTLSIVDDPDIKMVDEGWQFENDGKTITANVMIDSVLDSPKLLEVNSPIVKHLLDNNLAKPVHSKLGVLTDDDGYLIAQDGEKSIPIAFLGRLAKGTVIGVDAILECFGDRPENWAKKAVSLG